MQSPTRWSQSVRPSEATSVALLGPSGLGDALIQMVLAHNLAQNGFNVAVYNNYSYVLETYISEYEVYPFPPVEFLEHELSGYDAILHDDGSQYLKKLVRRSREWVGRRSIAYRMSTSPLTRIPESLSERLKKLSAQKPAVLQLLRLNRQLRIRSGKSKNLPVVQQMVTVLKQSTDLRVVDDGTGLTIKAQPIVDDGDSKVVIHPGSSRAVKNWSEEKFIALARLLKRNGLDPTFTVAPDEHAYWQDKIGGEFDLPVFPTVKELAEQYHSAAWFIGNDSGNAHLASCLGLPTLQVFHRRKSSPPWRAGWGHNAIVQARFPYRYLHQHWQKGVSTEKVFKQFNLFRQQVERLSRDNLTE